MSSDSHHLLRGEHLASYQEEEGNPNMEVTETVSLAGKKPMTYFIQSNLLSVGTSLYGL